jgi:hypothetical protein
MITSEQQADLSSVVNEQTAPPQNITPEIVESHDDTQDQVVSDDVVQPVFTETTQQPIDVPEIANEDVAEQESISNEPLENDSPVESTPEDTVPNDSDSPEVENILPEAAIEPTTVELPPEEELLLPDHATPDEAPDSEAVINQFSKPKKSFWSRPIVITILVIVIIAIVCAALYLFVLKTTPTNTVQTQYFGN